MDPYKLSLAPLTEVYLSVCLMFASHPLTECSSPMLQVMLSCVKIYPAKSRVHAFNFTMSLLTSVYQRKPDELASGNVM